jgi:hypothetical protein
MSRPGSRLFAWRPTTPQTTSLFPVRRHGGLQQWACGPAAVSRRRLCCTSVVVLLLSLGVAHAQPHADARSAAVATVYPFAGFIAEASYRFTLPVSSIRAVMRAESGGDVLALSPKGAMGLMQIMPATWAELRQRYGLGADPYDPRDNITAGTAYLRELLDRFGEPGFLAAYNAGPTRYEEHRATGRPLPSETVTYLATVTALLDGNMLEASQGAASWASSSLFVATAKAALAQSQASPNDASHRRSTNIATPLAPMSDGLFARTSDQRARP